LLILRDWLAQIFTLRAKLSGTVYCYRSCVFVDLFVCGSVTTITRNCVHRSSPNWVCRWRYWPSATDFSRHAPPGMGLRRGENFWLCHTTYYLCSVRVSPSAFFICT